MKALKNLLSFCFKNSAQPQQPAPVFVAAKPANPNHYSTNYKDYPMCG